MILSKKTIKIGVYSAIYRPISFKFHMIIETPKLFNLISV